MTSSNQPNPSNSVNRHHRKSSSGDFDPFSKPVDYYGPSTDPTKARPNSNIARARTFSVVGKPTRKVVLPPIRRGSQDEYTVPRKFLLNVDETLKNLLESEDTDKNFQITIEDTGPKVIRLGTVNSNGFKTSEVRGTYMLSNLLQELTTAKRLGRKTVIIDEQRLSENPVKRLSRLISTQFWDSLTRRIDADMIDIISVDPKRKNPNDPPRIYVDQDEKEQYEYYQEISRARPELHLDVQYLPKEITAEYVKSLNDKPGILALAMEKSVDPVTGKKSYKGVPYVVPGGRFNELYGWDSYMESLGLLVDNREDLAKGMVINFCYEIDHYGKILNANRSYYLCRSQPPFLTDMALRVYNKIATNSPDADEFLLKAFTAAIKEYYTVWMSEPRLDVKSGLSRYRPDGVGIPPETEASHFVQILKPFASKYNVSLDEFQKMYNGGEVKEPELDEYFLHDRAVRESGHDTSYRLEGRCADLATIDLNCLLYKYESDIMTYIESKHGGRLELSNGSVETSDVWKQRISKRKELIDKYMWSESAGMYFDYNTKSEQISTFESATTFWALWCGVASEHQAQLIMEKALPKFEMFGGLVSGTEESRGKVGLTRPNRQWDYPYGWAPQQILAWTGLIKYGYRKDAERLIYRWLYMITKAFVDFNGAVVEKYDVTREDDPHKVDAEYGNQGLDFRGVATEGFGWVNASFTYGLSFLDILAKRALGTCTPPDIFFASQQPRSESPLIEEDGPEVQKIFDKIAQIEGNSLAV